MKLASVLVLAVCLGIPLSDETPYRAAAGRNFAMYFHAAAASSGATYWVAPEGNDGGSGQAEDPFRTLQRAVDAAGPGDTVIVRDGIYGRAGCIKDTDYAVDIRNSGSPTDFIRIRAENKWRAVLDGERTCHSYINFGPGAAYISVEDFVIRNSYWSALWSNADAHHIVVRGNTIEDIGNWVDSTTPYAFTGLYTGSSNNNFTIDGNVFRNVGRRSGSYNHDHALYLHGTDFVITNNVFYNMKYGWPIQTAEGFGNALIANNTFAFPLSARDGQIVLWQTNFNLTIRNNIFYSPKRYAIVRADSRVNGCQVDNNIVFGAGALIDDPTGCTLSGNRIGIDPRFVNVDSEPYNFHLRPDSPAIRAGVFVPEVRTDFDGNPRARGPITVGAYEFEASGTGARRVELPAGPIR